MEIIIHKPKELKQTIYIEDIKENEMGFYVCLNEKEPLKSIVLKWFGYGQAFGDFHCIWVNLSSEHLNISRMNQGNRDTKPYRYYKSKVEAIQAQMENSKWPIVKFYDYDKFLKYAFDIEFEKLFATK